MRAVGIDPGLQGALACIDGGVVVDVLPMPLAGGNVIDVREVRRILKAWAPDRVFVEAFLAVKFQGVKGTATGASNHGRLLAAVELAGHEPVLLNPKDWQRTLGLQKDETATVKVKAIAHARYLFPSAGLSLTDSGKADALLIAYAGSLTFRKLRRRSA
jgi:hypothetical protein